MLKKIIFVITLLIGLGVTESKASLTYRGQPYIKWNSNMSAGTLYCYGSMMYTCCVRTGWNTLFIPGYNITVTVLSSVVEYDAAGNEIGSEHEFEVQE